MRKRIIFYGFLIFLAAGIFYYRPYFENLYLLSKERIEELGLNPLSSVHQTAQKIVSAPPPLTSAEDSAGAHLTQKGVIGLTNDERKNNGRKPLRENSELHAAAEKKAQDILAKQYFAHETPDGKGPEYFVSSAGYSYIMIGENLALGNFADDRALVAGWMASPGHRENILRPQFQEIGVAVARGDYEGKTTWVAVQEFGAPSSICPAADAGLKTSIDAKTKEIDDLAKELKDRKGEMNNMSARSLADGEAIEEYNILVSQYKALAAKTKTLIQKYNAEVETFNNCVKNF
ncbi:MAG TPA: CAP domain-containing protein [Candidatus Bathyarchaeia archaeon]|nr:CAP domain-containing protein [Candidatus Bathyarchaeia archaeon]